MKKFVTLFTDSYKELKSVRTITTAALLAASPSFWACFPSMWAVPYELAFPVFRTAYALICSDLSWAASLPEAWMCLSIC